MAVWKWVRKLSEKLSFEPPIPRGLMALDEARVKANGLEHRVYVAIDVDAI
jgi:transposase-like protein